MGIGGNRSRGPGRPGQGRRWRRGVRLMLLVAALTAGTTGSVPAGQARAEGLLNLMGDAAEPDPSPRPGAGPVARRPGDAAGAAYTGPPGQLSLTGDVVGPEPAARGGGDGMARPLPMPGDFEPLSALMLGANELVRYYPELFGGIVSAVYRDVPVICLLADAEERDLARELLRGHGVPESAVSLEVLPLDSMWVRDYGPIFVRRPDRTVGIVDLEYSQWDETDPRHDDNDVPRVFGKALGLPVLALPMKLSGGNLLSNGDGLCVTSEVAGVSLRPQYHKTQPTTVSTAEAGGVAWMLHRHLGFSQVLFLTSLKGEPTGDVDMFVAFVAPDVVVVARCDPAADPVNAVRLDEAARRLASVRTSRGPLRVHRIPMPPVTDGLWRSYTNVLFANGTLVVPSFSDVDPAIEKEVMDLYARLLPGWRIVALNADCLLKQKGLLHCIYRGVPAFVKLPDLRYGERSDLARGTKRPI